MVFLDRLDRAQGLTRCTKQIGYHCPHHLDRFGNFDGNLGTDLVDQEIRCIRDEGL